MAARSVRSIHGHLSTAQRCCKWPRIQSEVTSLNASSSPDVPCSAYGALAEVQSSGTLYGVERFSGSRVTERLINGHLVTGGSSFMCGSSPQGESFVPLEKVLRGLGFKQLQRSFRGSGSTQARYLTSGCVAQQQSLQTHKGAQTDLQTDMQISASQMREMKLKSIDEARVRIFGHMVGNGERSGHKVLRQKLIGEKILAWYPTPLQKLDPMYEDPNIRRLLLKNERLKRRGKGPPKKGHGKRASKRAK